MFHVLWWYFAKKNAAETLHQLSYSKGCCRIIEFSQWPMASQPTSPTVTTARNQAFLNPYIFLKGVRSGGVGEALMVCWWMSVIPCTATNEDLQTESCQWWCGFSLQEVYLQVVVLDMWCWFSPLSGEDYLDQYVSDGWGKTTQMVLDRFKCLPRFAVNEP